MDQNNNPYQQFNQQGNVSVPGQVLNNQQNQLYDKPGVSQ